jgi:hypothetical protein
MDQYELGVAMVVTHIAELRRQADRWRLARRSPDRTAGRRSIRTPGSPWVLGGHHHSAAARAAAPPWRPPPALPGRKPWRPRHADGHQHEPGVFDAGHCRACARQVGLLDHYRRVQQVEAALRQAHAWALEASRRASMALWSSGAAILLAAVALLSG